MIGIIKIIKKTIKKRRIAGSIVPLGLWSQNAKYNYLPIFTPSPRVNKECQNEIYFLTLTVLEWIDIFTKSEYFNIIIDSLKFCQTNKGLLLYEYVIMTNHIHLVASTKNNHGLSQVISDFKKHTTREILKQLEKDNRKYILNLLRNSYSKKSWIRKAGLAKRKLFGNDCFGKIFKRKNKLYS